MNSDDIIHLESLRQSIYKGLATCFSLPDTTLLPVLTRLEQLLAAFHSKARDEASQMVAYLKDIHDYTPITIEFTRLFVGPFGQLAPPYGSAYMDGTKTMMGDSTMDLLERYQKAGVGMAESFKDAPDHIVAELEFLSFLITKELEALDTETDKTPQVFLLQQKEFLTHHLGLWLAPFLEKIRTHTRSPLYQALANIVHTIVQEEIEYLDTMLFTEADHPPINESSSP